MWHVRAYAFVRAFIAEAGARDVDGFGAQIVAGEVVMPDPWGISMRGQYALLDLTDAEAAMGKVLRIGDGDDAATARDGNPAKATIPGVAAASR